jgi:hypothetical protein
LRDRPRSIYAFRYRKEQFADLPRDKFLKALAAAGIGASSQYHPGPDTARSG